MPNKPIPPIAERRPTVLSAHGDDRVDDWYWLSDRDDPALVEVLDAEAGFLKAATADLGPLVEAVYGEVIGRVQLTDVSLPAPKGRWAYYSRTVEGLEYPIQCRRAADAPPPPRDPPAGVSPTAPADSFEQIVLDLNVLAVGHDHLEIGDAELSPDQRLLAYSTDTSGAERFTIRIRDLTTNGDLDDMIENASYGLAFSADNSRLFFTRPDDSMRPYQIWRHQLGTEPGQDVCILEEPDEHYFLGVESTKDGALIVLVAESNTTSEVRLLDATDPDGLPRLVEARRQGVEYSVEHHGDEILVLTNDSAENFALYRSPAVTPDRSHWRPLVAQRDDVRLEAMDVIKGFVLLHERGHASTAVRLVDLAGGAEIVIAPPEDAGAVFLAENLDFDARCVRYASTSLVSPIAIHSHDLDHGTSEVIWQRHVPNYDAGLYRTERRWATSKDGTSVPISLAYRADRPARPGPVLLYGYGSYGISTDPVFTVDHSILPLLDRGGCYAIAHVRGGEEMSRSWYLDGKLEHKQHTFEDFVACARFLVSEGLTSPDQLVAMGASAGGLLVGASVNLAPELFAAAVAGVPFVDCLTTMLDEDLPLTVTEREEWGDPAGDEDAYWRMKSYSPYDNVRPVRYPKMLVTSGMNDPRVSYAEPVKWVQKLRSAHADNASRILLKMERDSGHHGPSGRYQAWKDWAFELAFVLEAAGAEALPGREAEGSSQPAAGLKSTS
ncbi:MAG: S9 family peptidase [Acidimicrobiales bacterium]